jgi:hypothetical protein
MYGRLYGLSKIALEILKMSFDDRCILIITVFGLTGSSSVGHFLAALLYTEPAKLQLWIVGFD